MELFKYALGEAALLALTRLLTRIERALAEVILLPTTQRYKRVVHLAAKLWQGIITIPWIPVYFCSTAVAIFQAIIVETTMLTLAEWESFLVSADHKPDAEPTWNVRISRLVRDWVAKDKRAARLVLILFCKFVVLEGTLWSYPVALRLFGLIVMVSQPSLLWAAVWIIGEVLCRRCGQELLEFVHLDRLILHMLSLGANIVPLDDKLTPFGRAHDKLLPFSVLSVALTVAARNISVKQTWTRIKFHDAAQQRPPSNEPGRQDELLLEEFNSYCYTYVSFRTSWHAMALLHGWECSTGLGTSWSTLFIKVVFGISIRLIILNSHLSLGGWRV